jgi:2,2-dialkylglycine decarboxylase (pyruvate)
VTPRCAELGLQMNIVQLPGMSGTPGSARVRIAPPLTTVKSHLES